jgi:hypothetical protein
MNNFAASAAVAAATPTATPGRSKSKLNAQMKEQHDNISEKMEGGILVRRYKGVKIEM